MILVDTSVWVDHLRTGDRRLVQLLDAEQVFTHPFVIGEIALGILPQRSVILATLRFLPEVLVAAHEEVLEFIERYQLFGSGVGYVDAHLLAAIKLTAGTGLWTRDKSLRAVAERLALIAEPPS
ncbi:MAG TPA: type II toxin-antitoxin system VapC family toxin [Xanthobacteraceae bacterium]|nr:type II toxin-antitoxin system VapC family toxin [Xanthobacteraceae bacterium]